MFLGMIIAPPQVSQINLHMITRLARRTVITPACPMKLFELVRDVLSTTAYYNLHQQFA